MFKEKEFIELGLNNCIKTVTTIYDHRGRKKVIANIQLADETSVAEFYRRKGEQSKVDMVRHRGCNGWPSAKHRAFVLVLNRFLNDELSEAIIPDIYAMINLNDERLLEDYDEERLSEMVAEEEPLKLELVRDGFDRYGAKEWRATENGTTFIGEVISSSLRETGWNGRDNYDWTYGLCPECEKIDGFLSIGSLNFAFCLEHRLAWTHTWGAWDVIADWYTPEVEAQNTEFLCKNFKQAEGWEKFESEKMKLIKLGYGDLEKDLDKTIEEHIDHTELLPIDDPFMHFKKGGVIEDPRYCYSSYLLHVLDFKIFRALAKQYPNSRMSRMLEQLQNRERRVNS